MPERFDEEFKDKITQEMWDDPFRIIRRRYWMHDDEGEWIQTTPVVFERSVRWWAGYHLPADEPTHPPHHYTLLQNHVRSELIIRTIQERWQPPKPDFRSRTQYEFHPRRP